MEYVILGAGAAGITAAKTIRKADKNGKITVISTDTQVHSRCMLHKYLSHERDAAGISFVDPDFFEKNQITWLPGKTVNRLDTQGKKVYTDQGDEVSYDRLLIATGAESFIPPVGNLREAENVFGLRHLRDAQAIDELAKDVENIVIIGSGLVGNPGRQGVVFAGAGIDLGLAETAPVADDGREVEDMEAFVRVCQAGGFQIGGAKHGVLPQKQDTVAENGEAVHALAAKVELEEGNAGDFRVPGRVDLGILAEKRAVEVFSAYERKVGGFGQGRVGLLFAAGLVGNGRLRPSKDGRQGQEQGYEKFFHGI